jgi:preprotein translocase subunit SecG
MYGFVLTVHVLICFLMIVVILLQSGKGGGLAGAFGGGASTAVFGGRGATTVLTRATMVLGILFFMTSLTLALTGGSTRPASRSLLQEEARRAAPTSGAPAGAGGFGQPATPQTLPAAPAPATTTPSTPAPTGAAPAPAPSGGR